jgi:RimJ/RimL family protein N-acetyltransferase
MVDMTMLQTERLLLRKWEPTDLEAYVAMCSNPEVMRFISPDGKPMSRFDAWRNLAVHTGHWYLKGFGQFAVVERCSGELVGRVGPWQPDDWPDFEIGWALRSEYWGRGYATEAVRACIEYSFTTLGRTHLVSIIDSENIRSIE